MNYEYIQYIFIVFISALSSPQLPKINKHSHSPTHPKIQKINKQISYFISCPQLFLPLIITTMFQWKCLELSSQDYQNYISNEDSEQLRINDLNVTEWQSLYHEAQTRALQNRNIKKQILMFQNSIRAALQDGRVGVGAGKRQTARVHARMSADLKIHLSELYGQLSMLHLKNLSTTVEFLVSRLLSLQEELIRVNIEAEDKNEQLQERIQHLSMKKHEQICVQCHQQSQKKRHRFLARQILATGQPATEVEEKQAGSEQKQIQFRSKMIQEQDYELGRYCYLSSVDDILRNKQKTLKCSSAPLQNLLSEYLQQILEMLDGQKLGLAPKNIRDYQRISRTFQNLQDMKAMVDFPGLLQRAEGLLQKPFRNLVEAVQKSLRGGIKMIDAQVQFESEGKGVERQLRCLTLQLQALKSSKSKSQNDMLNNLQNLHRIQLKNMDLSSKNKQLEGQVRKLQKDVIDLKQKISNLDENHRQDQDRLIDRNIFQRNRFQQDIRALQARFKKTEAVKKHDSGCQTQDDYRKTLTSSNQNYNGPYLGHMNTNMINEAERPKKKMTLAKSRKQGKKISIRLLQIKNEQMNEDLNDKTGRPSIGKQNNNQKSQVMQLCSIKMNTSSGFRRSQQSKESKVNKSKDNSVVERRELKKQRDRQHLPPSTLRICTVNPLHIMVQQSGDRLQRVIRSSMMIGQPSESLQRSKIAKKTQFRWGHGHHTSEIPTRNCQNESDCLSKVQIGASRLELVTGHALVHKNDQVKNGVYSPLLESQEDIVNVVQNKFQAKSKLSKQNAITPSRKKINQPSSFNQTQRQQQGKKDKKVGSLPAKIQNFIKYCLQHYQQIEGNDLTQLITEYSQLKDKSQLQKLNGSKLQAYKTKVQTPIKAHKQTLNVANAIEFNSNFNVQNLDLFFNETEAEKYEKGQGIWGEVDHCLMLDNNFSTFSEQIQRYFDSIRVKNPPFYHQILCYLTNPHSYKKGERKIIEYTQKDRFWIRDLFRKLLRLHKLVHRRCLHVNKFLTAIGFSK